MFLACFLFLLIIITGFYGTSTKEGFTIEDYHWSKDDNNEWGLQKLDEYKDVNKDKFNESLDIEDIPVDGVIPDGYMQIGESTMVKVPESVVTTPIELVPISEVSKEYIPDSGIMPSGYYKLNQFQMVNVPGNSYIYDENNLAEIPSGYQASEDKKYIFRTSDEIQSQIEGSETYNPSDFNTYRDGSITTTSDSNISSIYTQQPVTRDPQQFLLDEKDSNLTNNSSYVNAIVDGNPSIRERDYKEGTMGDYRASPSYSFYDNHTIINTSELKNTPGMLGGFCEQNKHSIVNIEKKCSKLDKQLCASTNCCVLLGTNTCVAGNERGPSYQDHYRNPLIKDRDYYYYKGKCYGNCKHH